jgi:hypothetical protein
MMKRLVKAGVSGGAVVMVFVAGFSLVARLAHLCDEHHLVWERRSPLTQWVTRIAPRHDWQWWTCGLLLFAGFGWLTDLANESAAVVLHRLFLAFVGVAACASALPLVAGSALWQEPRFEWMCLVLPLLCSLPLGLAVAKFRQDFGPR